MLSVFQIIFLQRMDFFYLGLNRQLVLLRCSSDTFIFNIVFCMKKMICRECQNDKIVLILVNIYIHFFSENHRPFLQKDVESQLSICKICFILVFAVSFLAWKGRRNCQVQRIKVCFSEFKFFCKTIREIFSNDIFKDTCLWKVLI